MVSSALALIITGFMFLTFFICVFGVLFFILGKFGLWKWATYRRLKKRYKHLDFNDDALKWAIDKINKKWKFKDIRRFVKYEGKEGGELLYAFLVLSKLSPQELDSYKEVNDDGGQTTNRPEEEVSRTLPEIPEERGN